MRRNSVSVNDTTDVRREKMCTYQLVLHNTGTLTKLLPLVAVSVLFENGYKPIKSVYVKYFIATDDILNILFMKTKYIVENLMNKKENKSIV